MKYSLVPLRDRPDMLPRAAAWFHQKWSVPLKPIGRAWRNAYWEKSSAPVVSCPEGDRIVGGMGVIENDFHDRKDLAPTCAPSIREEDRRCQGIAGALLNWSVGI